MSARRLFRAEHTGGVLWPEQLKAAWQAARRSNDPGTTATPRTLAKVTIAKNDQVTKLKRVVDVAAEVWKESV